LADDDAEMVSSNKFANGANQNCGNVISDRPTTRIHHAPGGRSTICLGMPEESTQKPVDSGRFAPGGPTTVSLTYDETPSKSVGDEALKIMEESSKMKAAGGEALSCAGKATVCLGTLDSEVPAASPERSGQLQPPGGNSTICLGVDDEHVVLQVDPSGRQAPGGVATLRFDGQEDFAVRAGHRATTRINQAPGGHSTLCLGEQQDSTVAETPKTSGRQAPGGESTLCLGLATCEEEEAHRSLAQALQPPGGNATICLGVADDEVVLHVDPSGRQPPGGNTTFDLAGENEMPASRPATARQTPGGTTTICLGMKDASPKKRRGDRFPPGGKASICFGDENDENSNVLNTFAVDYDASKKAPQKILGTRSLELRAN
jgi:hypothetical protein